MISEGIYEQIVNKKLGKEIQSFDPALYDIELSELNADDARKVLTIYVSAVVQKGLRYIRESFCTDEDDQALLAQIELCNDIICEIASHSEVQAQPLVQMSRHPCIKGINRK